MVGGVSEIEEEEESFYYWEFYLFDVVGVFYLGG